MGSLRYLFLGLVLMVSSTSCTQLPRPPVAFQTPPTPGATPVPPVDLTQDWYSYTSPQGGYRAKFPGKPQEEKQAIATPQGASDLFMVVYEDRANNRAYAISHNRLAANQGNRLDIEKGLDGSRDGIARGVGANVTQETVIRRDTYTGREIWLNKANRMVGKARIFYANGALYQIFVLIEGQDLNRAPEVDAFLDSVQLTRQ